MWAFCGDNLCGCFVERCVYGVGWAVCVDVVYQCFVWTLCVDVVYRRFVWTIFFVFFEHETTKFAG